jgi:hypothetical protein
MIKLRSSNSARGSSGSFLSARTAAWKPNAEWRSNLRYLSGSDSNSKVSHAGRSKLCHRCYRRSDLGRRFRAGRSSVAARSVAVAMTDHARPFAPPWTIDDNGGCFIVKDHNGTIKINPEQSTHSGPLKGVASLQALVIRAAWGSGGWDAAGTGPWSELR